MFIPTTLDGADKIIETIQEIKEKIPLNPFEADLLTMAAMIAEEEEKEKTISHGGLYWFNMLYYLLSSCMIFSL